MLTLQRGYIGPNSGQFHQYLPLPLLTGAYPGVIVEVELLLGVAVLHGQVLQVPGRVRPLGVQAQADLVYLPYLSYCNLQDNRAKDCAGVFFCFSTAILKRFSL